LTQPPDRTYLPPDGVAAREMVPDPFGKYIGLSGAGM
jgi:hypothetical protein